MISTLGVALTLFVGVVPALFGQRTVGRPPSATAALVGQWRLNLARTHYGSGVDVRQRESFTCEMHGPRLRCVIHSVRQDGRELVGQFAAALDRSPAPVTGISDVDTVELSQPAPSLLDATFFFRGKPTFAYRAYRSIDGASLVIVSVDPTSRAVLTTVVVYDRQ